MVTQLAHLELTNTLSETITSQVYMDNTNWIGSSKQQIEQTLSIAHDFYKLNNILVNDHKTVLMTTAVQESQIVIPFIEEPFQLLSWLAPNPLLLLPCSRHNLPIF